MSNGNGKELEEGLLFGMGNPLLDMAVRVDMDFLAKYNLEANNAILAEPIHVPMYDELKKTRDVEFTAGGATQNVLRVVQWIIKKKNVTTFMGSIGDDENGKTLLNAATADGVNVQYQITSNTPTGTCAALLTGNHRSLCAYLAAAEKFTIAHLDQHFEYVEKALFYCISGFFLTVSPDSALKVARFARDKNRPFTFNLSAPFIVEFFGDRVKDVLPYVDILFGNESEARQLSKLFNWNTEDVAEIAKKVLELPKENKSRPRTVVFTQGSDPVIVAEEGKEIKTYDVVRLDADKIVDTNGAGDSFVGGFLAQYIQGNSLEESVKCGLWAAYHIIQNYGCTFPKDLQYDANQIQS